MIQKGSVLRPTDSCGVFKVRVFHVYKGSKGRIAYIGDFVKVSVREIRPENPIKKKSKLVSILVRSSYINKRFDGSTIRFKKNRVVLLKRRLTPKGKSLKGSISRNIRRKKFLSSFSKSI